MSIRRIRLDYYVQEFQAFLTECTKYWAGEDVKIDYTAAPLWLLIVAVVFVLLFSSFERQKTVAMPTRLQTRALRFEASCQEPLDSWIVSYFFVTEYWKKEKKNTLTIEKMFVKVCVSVCAHVRVSVWLPTRITPYICTCVFRTIKPVGFFSPLIRGSIPSCQWCLLSFQTQHCTVLVPVAWLQSSHFCSHSTVA